MTSIDFITFREMKLNWLLNHCADIILRAMRTLKRIPLTAHERLVNFHDAFQQIGQR